MIAKHGKAAHCSCDCPFFFEVTRDSVSELVFSLRHKRRIGKARLEAARWSMRTSFEPQSVLCQFSVSQVVVPLLVTLYVVKGNTEKGAGKTKTT